jgi:hypothetical protein
VPDFNCNAVIDSTCLIGEEDFSTVAVSCDYFWDDVVEPGVQNHVVLQGDFASKPPHAPSSVSRAA